MSNLHDMDDVTSRLHTRGNSEEMGKHLQGIIQSYSDLYDVCRRAASKLSIPWPTTKYAEGTEQDLYDGM